jgi:hypothetical protein
MESHAKLAGHAIHPMLIVFPLGLLATAVLFDLIYLFTGNTELVTFSYWTHLMIGPGRTEVRRWVGHQRLAFATTVGSRGDT